LCLSSVTWQLRIYQGLRDLDGAELLPLLQVLWFVFSVLSCGIFFDEFSAMTPAMAPFYVLGCISIFISIYFFVPERRTQRLSYMDRNMTMQARETRRGLQYLRSVTHHVGIGLTDFQNLPEDVQQKLENTVKETIAAESGYAPRRSLRAALEGSSARSKDFFSGMPRRESKASVAAMDARASISGRPSVQGRRPSQKNSPRKSQEATKDLPTKHEIQANIRRNSQHLFDDLEKQLESDLAPNKFGKNGEVEMASRGPADPLLPGQ